MKTKIILIITLLFWFVSIFSQSVFLEQDVKIIDKTQLLFCTQLQYNQRLWNSGLSTGPYIKTSYIWHEILWTLNYKNGIVSLGIGGGIEKLDTWSLRYAPWIQIEPKLGLDSNESIKMYSYWEFGKGINNYWYTNSITYETPDAFFGLLARKLYGVGPIVGLKFKFGTWIVKTSIAPLYDFDDKMTKPTAILTLTN